jgi:hypothetical protein
VRALPDVVENVLREARAEDRDPVPLGFRDPFVFGVFPGPLRGDGKHGELRTVALGLALFGIGSDESNDCYGIDYVESGWFSRQTYRWVRPRGGRTQNGGTNGPGVCDL